jgi:hypothetical protein
MTLSVCTRTFLISLSCFVLVSFSKTYYAKPYEFIGLGVFCLMVNILFMTRLVYYTRQFKQLVFEKYLGISEPVLRDMKKQEEQTAIRMAAMRKAQAEKELAAAEAKRRQRLGTADSSSAMTDDDGTGSASSTGRRSQNDSNDSDDSPRPSGQQTAGGTSQLASSQHFTDRLSMPTAIWMYLRSLAALAGFAVVIDRAGLGTIGYITAAAIVWMDLVVMCWMYGQRERTPLQACILLCMIRFFMIIFGPTYYLVGHTILFIALSCFFTWQLIDRFLPLSKLRAKTDDEEEIIPQGIAPPTVQRATSVIVESMGNSATREAAARRLQRESRRAAHLATIQSQTSFTQICSLLLLLAAFIFDTVLSYYQDPNTTIPSGLYTRLPQALVGFFGLFVWVVYAMSAWTFRLYVNAHYKSRGWVQFLAATQYVFILGCGWIYYYFNHEKNIPVLCLFLPPIVYFLIGLYSQWVKNDFRVILPKRLRTPPQAHWTEAFWRCGFPANDYFMVWSVERKRREHI